MGRRTAKQKPLLSGARTHAAEALKALASQKDIPDEVRRGLLDIVNTPSVEVPLRPGQAIPELISQSGKRRPIAEVVAEGISGRLPHPAAQTTSIEPLPREFAVLRSTKMITPASEAAAQRLGFELSSSGSALDSVYQYLQLALVEQKLKGPEHAGQFSNLFSPVAEFALNNNKDLRATEDKAARKAIAKVMGTDTNSSAVDYLILEKYPPLPVSMQKEFSDALTVLRRYRAAPGLLDVELYNVRDTRGRKGWLVTDRLRGLLDLRTKPPRFVVVSIGEAKAKSGYNKILAQITDDVKRLLEGFRRSGAIPVSESFETVEVSFGPELVVASLSEETPPANHRSELVENIRAIFVSENLPPPAVIPKEIDVAGTFSDARIIARDFQAALNALQSPTTKPQ